MKRKIAAIMAADVAGYSRLVAEDEEETLRRLAAYREVFDDFIAKAAGRIFSTAGDAVLAEFSSAVEAVRCAIDVQESLRTRNLAYPPSRQMSFRIGITIGDVVEREGDLLGDGVNIAARLEGIAPVGGICVSRTCLRAGRQQAVGAVRRHRRAAGQEHSQPGACLHRGDERRDGEGQRLGRRSAGKKTAVPLICRGSAAAAAAAVAVAAYFFAVSAGASRLRLLRPPPSAPCAAALPAAPAAVAPPQVKARRGNDPDGLRIATAPAFATTTCPRPATRRLPSVRAGPTFLTGQPDEAERKGRARWRRARPRPMPSPARVSTARCLRSATRWCRRARIRRCRPSPGWSAIQRSSGPSPPTRCR